MARNDFDKHISRTVNTVNKAFNKTMRRVGLQEDNDLHVYETLQPVDFDDLAHTFGETEVMDYINTMEKKRLLD